MRGNKKTPVKEMEVVAEEVMIEDGKPNAAPEFIIEEMDFHNLNEFIVTAINAEKEGIINYQASFKKLIMTLNTIVKRK